MDSVVESISEKSFGEFRGGKEYDKIEEEIRKKRSSANKKKAAPETAKHLDVQTLAPFLSHVTQVSNHNLGVATFYQVKLQEAQTLLARAQETAYNAERKAEHLERKYEIHTAQLEGHLAHTKNILASTQEELADCKNQISLHLHTLEERNALLEQKQHLIEGLQASYALKEEETQNLRQQLAASQSNCQSLQEENTQIRLKKGEFEALQRELESTRISYEKQLNEERKKVSHFESLMIMEVRQKEQVLKDQEPLRHRLEIAEKNLSETQRVAEIQRIEVKRLTEQLRLHELRFQERIKEEVNEFQQKNIERIVILEKALEESQKKAFKLEGETEQLRLQLANKEGEVAYYVKEYEGMDDIVKRTLEEKKSYLGEFHKLKTQYEIAIEKIQKTLLQTQLQLVHVQDDLKNAHVQIRRQAQKIEDLTQMHAFMNVGDEYIREQSKREVYDHQLNEQARTAYERKTALIEQEADRLLRDDIELKRESAVGADAEDHYEEEWQRLFKNIASVENKLGGGIV